MKKAVLTIKILVVLAIAAWIIKTPYEAVKERVVTIVCWTAFLVGLYLAGKLAIKIIKKQKYLHSSIYKIDKMTGIEFEQCLKAHFEKNGYKVNTTPTSGDYGVDLLCHKKKECIAVQAKRYQGKIGIEAVQQVIGGMHYYDCEKGMVITNSYFTKNACELAKKSNVELWDRDVLIRRFKVKEK